MTDDYKRIVLTFDRLASGYAESGGMEEVNRLLLAPEVKEWEGRLLDVGCGAGAFIEKYIEPERHEVFTVDFSKNMLEETRVRLEGKIGQSLFLVHALAQALPFQRDVFDGVLSVNTLHNMPGWPDIRRAVREMARVLRPRGLMLIEFRNRNHPWRRHITEVYDKPDLPQKSFTVEEITADMESLHFDIEKIIPLSGEEPPSNILHNTMDEIRRRCVYVSPKLSPRFAVIARKSPGFHSYLLEKLEAGE